MNPLLTIITINLNNATGLSRTVQSVVNQNYIDFEYIIIDGGSTDNSVDVINKYRDKINHWVSEPDKGIYNAMNKGIQQANGAYLLFLNSGDELDNVESLASINTILLEEDIIYTNLIIKDTQSKYTKEYPKTLSFNYFLTDSLPHPATFIKKNLFERIGYYDEELKICSDWAFFINAICKHNATYKYFNTNLSVFYFDGISSSTEYSALILAERNRVLQRDFPLYLSVIDELKEARLLKQHLRNSRLLKIARKLGFLKQLLKEN